MVKNKENKSRRGSTNSNAKASAVYSSESDDTNAKTTAKRKPSTKPKASATVTPVTKNNKSVPKPIPAKKPIPTLKQANRPQTKESTKNAPKPDQQKKLKTKSIFSPDNSSESDEHTATPPPPKLTAMKTAATSKALKPKSKVKKEPVTSTTPSDKSRGSSLTSNSSGTSGSSGKSENLCFIQEWN